MNVLIGLFLILHGLVPIPLAFAPGADGRVGTWLFDTNRLWLTRLLGEAALRPVAWALIIPSAIAFILAGFAWLGWVPAAWWGPAAITAAALQLVFLILFWHPWLVVGLVLNTAITLAAILKWTPAAR